MGSAEQEVIIENVQPLVPDDEGTTAVSCDVCENETNIENEGTVAYTSVASELQ